MRTRQLWEAARSLWHATAIAGALGLAMCLGTTAVHGQVFDYDQRLEGGYDPVADEWYGDYEDEWYDPTDWFDGNNYEFDDTWGPAWGYYDHGTVRDDWFYDYYDTGYATYFDDNQDGIYDSYYRYFDFDNSGVQDAMVAFHDRDSDGYFEDVNYYGFHTTNRSEAEKAARQQSPTSKRYEVTAEITHTKTAKRDGFEHLVVALDKRDGRKLVADLGRADRLEELDLRKGDRITLRGPATQIGDKRILLVETLRVDGKEHPIDRSGRKLQGEVTRTGLATVRGTQHVMVKLEAKSGKQVWVDLGPERNLGQVAFGRGDRIAVTGPAVKIQDQHVVMAEKLTHDGETMKIDRRVQSEKSRETARR